MVMAQPSQSPTWLGQAKIRSQTIGDITNVQTSPSVQVPFDLPQVGYLESLDLSTILSFTFSVAPTATDAFGAVQGQLNRVTIFVNSIGNLCDVSGFSLGLITAIEYDYRYGNSSLQATPSAFVAHGSVGTSSKTNKWFHRIPLGLYLNNFPYPIGLFQTALQNLSVRLIVRWLPVQGTAGNPGSGSYSGGTVSVQSAGQISINETYFDPITAPSAQPYLGFIHRWTEYQNSLTHSGDNDYQLPGQNYYLRLIYEIVENGALSSHLDRLRLRYGANLAPFDEDETKNEVGQRMQRQYNGLFAGLVAGFDSIPLYPGVYWHDFIADTHDNRDWINAAATTNLRATLTMDAAGTYTGVSYVNIVTEEVAPLALPAGAVVQGQAPVQ